MNGIIKMSLWFGGKLSFTQLGCRWVFREDGGGEPPALPDWPVGVDLCLHLVSPRHFSVVAHLPHRVVLHHSARLEEGARAALVELLALCDTPWGRSVEIQSNSGRFSFWV